MEIDTTSESLSAPVQPKSFVSSASSNAALSIVDELTDRERREKNIVVYNLTECSDRKTDIETFKALSNNVFKLDVNIAKAIRLGPKIANKQRPLLLTFEDIYDKICLLSHSYFLRRYDQYNRIYFAPDRTQLERVKHKKVVEELKQRRAKGETGLIIRNGTVTNKQSHCSNSTQSPDAQTTESTTQSS